MFKKSIAFYHNKSVEDLTRHLKEVGVKFHTERTCLNCYYFQGCSEWSYDDTCKDHLTEEEGSNAENS